MSSPIDIEESQAPFRRAYHLATTWEDSVLIWGGSNETETLEERTSVVYMHVSGKWIRKETSGDILKSLHHASVHVLDNTMYALVQGQCKNGPCRDCDTNPVYCLDLSTWTWTRFIPSGIPPLKGTKYITSWVYKGKIYGFGGKILDEHQSCYGYPSYLKVTYGTSNQLFCYNTSRNCWEWPNLGGNIPSPRIGSTTISEDTAFLFGGVTSRKEEQYTDLYILDMKTFIWKKVHDNITNGVDHMMQVSRISKSTAVLSGWKRGSKSFHFWFLDLDSAKQLKKPSDIWTNISIELKYRPGYVHVQEPVSQRLWLVGGYDSFKRNNFSVPVVLKISLKPAPLKSIAMECAIHNISSDDPRLQPGELPVELRREIESHKSGTSDR